MDLKTIKLVGDCVCATAYLASPAVIWWGARHATRIPGWKKLTTLLLVAALGEVVSIVNYFTPDIKLLTAWSVGASLVCIAMTAMLWEVVARKTQRFTDLPSEAATEYIDKIPFPACIVGGHGQAIAVNQKYSQLMGVTMHDIEEGCWLSYVHTSDQKRVETRWMDFFENRADRFNEDFLWNHPQCGWITVRGIGHVNGKCVFCSIQLISSTRKPN